MQFLESVDDQEFNDQDARMILSGNEEGLHGLIAACGCKSKKHTDTLGLSAKSAMVLLKPLVIDYKYDPE